jgi:23S rRNA (guanosine2251-2'-O)-methyltransferase
MTNEFSKIFGKHPIIDSINFGRTFEKVYIQQGLRGEVEIEIRKITKLYDIPLVTVAKEKLNKIAEGGNHQGLIGIVSPIQYYKLEDIIHSFFDHSAHPLILILDQISDVKNFGAIVRSAEVFGVNAIVVSFKGTAQINSETMKASAGALNNIPICREKSITNSIQLLQDSGISVIVSDLSATKKITDLDMNMPLAIIMGSEGEGVNPAFLSRSNERFIIPQIGKTESLNVSVATGVILYEVQRQRGF